MNRDRSLIALFFTCLLLICNLNLCSPSKAQGTEPEKVPEPYVVDQHDFNNQSWNERWWLTIQHGDVMTLIGASDLNQHNESLIQYQFHIHYVIKGELYIAGIDIIAIEFHIGNQRILTPMDSCEHFELAHTPVSYDGAIPTMDVNIIYKRIHMYPNTTRDSTFDLTLRHHLRMDWNQTDTKFEALFEFNNTRFFKPDNTEFDEYEPFTTEILYSMSLSTTKDNKVTGQVEPAGWNSTAVNYDLTLDNGAPLIISKLGMTNNFHISDENGTHDSVSYSSMEEHNRGVIEVTHGFPNLSYKNTRAIVNDPDLTVFHDRVTKSWRRPYKQPSLQDKLMIAIVVICPIVAICAIVSFRRRKMKNAPTTKKKK